MMRLIGSMEIAGVESSGVRVLRRKDEGLLRNEIAVYCFGFGSEFGFGPRTGGFKFEIFRGNL